MNLHSSALRPRMIQLFGACCPSVLIVRSSAMLFYIDCDRGGQGYDCRSQPSSIQPDVPVFSTRKRETGQTRQCLSFGEFYIISICPSAYIYIYMYDTLPRQSPTSSTYEFSRSAHWHLRVRILNRSMPKRHLVRPSR